MAYVNLVGAVSLVSLVTCLAFRMDGSQSYAAYPKWKLCTNGSAKLEFKTLNMNGLLLYLDDGGKKDFVELKLVGGNLKLHFNFGDGPVIIIGGQELSDGKWHTAEIKRNGKTTTLQVDTNSYTKVATGTHLTMGDLEHNSLVYVGGLPNTFMKKLDTLAIPSVLFEPRWQGSVRNILFSNCGGSYEQFALLESKGISNDQIEDLCEKNKQCLHGGICLSRNGAFSCDCSATDYTGEYCQTERVPSVATFKGAQYLSYDITNRGDSITSSIEEISLLFRTRQASGLIFYTGDGVDYINVAIKEGGIIMTMNLGSGTYEQDVKPFPDKKAVRFDDNLWHSLLITREAREISIAVDETFHRTGTVTGSFTMLSSRVLYLAGSPDTASLPGSRVRDNFRGCLKKVEYKADSVQVRITELAKNKNQFISTHGEVILDRCEDLIHSQAITFTYPQSHIYLPEWHKLPEGFTVKFQFRTNEPNGLIMYNNNVNNNGAKNSSSFFALELLNGFIYLVINLGAGTLKMKTNDSPVNDGVAHTFEVSILGKSGFVSMDDIRKPFQLPHAYNQLSLNGRLYIGGSDTNHMANLLPKEIWSAMLGYGYTGCIQDLYISAKPVDLTRYGKEQEADGIAEFCHVLPSKCSSNPCLHSGNCSEGWNRFICDCTSTGYYGLTCDEVATTVSFDGTQHMKISMPEESRTEAEDISLRFQTQRANGLLFATTSEESVDHLELMLDAGRVRLDADLGSGPKSLYAGRGLNDDQWHTVHIQRRARSLSLQVDRHAPVTDKVEGDSKTINFKNIEIGKTDKYAQNDAPKPKPRSNYAGYMQQFELNKNNLFKMAQTRPIQNIEVTAKFNKKEKIYHFPVTFKTADSYITTKWNPHRIFTLYFAIKTTQSAALIMYIGNKGEDFMAVELVDGLLRFSYNVGNGPKHMTVKTKKPLNDNEWHMVAVLRHTVNKHTVRVDGTSTVDSLSDDRNSLYDVDGYLYIGGVPQVLYSKIPKVVQSRSGYQGCISSLDIGEGYVDLFNHNMDVPALYKLSVLEGCEGPSVQCLADTCENGGVCIQEWSQLRCDCDMTSYAGDRCQQESESYTFENSGGLITFEYRPPYPDTSKDVLVLGFRTTQENCVLVRVDTGKMDDYIELELVKGNVFVVYNMGTMDHPIAQLDTRVNDGKYHVVRFTRSGPNSTIQVDDSIIQTKNPTGEQLKIFNDQRHVHIGGKKNPNHSPGQIVKPFKGTISGLVFNKLRILDLCANGDPRIRIEGDVKLQVPGPGYSISPTVNPSSGRAAATPVPSGRTPDTQSTMGVRTTPKAKGVTNELIVASGGSGCHEDDEDDCKVTPPTVPDDRLITPTVTVTTLAPTTTISPNTKDKTTPKNNLPKPVPPPEGSGSTTTTECDDDEDCNQSGSGELPHPSKPSPGYNHSVEDIFLSTAEPVKEPQNETQFELVIVDKVDKSMDGEKVNNNVSSSGETSTVDSMFITVNITETHTRKSQPVITSAPDTGDDTVTHQDPKSSLGVTTAAINLAIIIGAGAAGLLILLCLIYAIWRCKRKDIGSYKIDESKNYSIDPKTQPQQTNGMPAKPGMTMPRFEKSKKNVKEWYV